MTYVHVGKVPVPRCIVPSFPDEVFYPGSAPAGVTPQYFTTLNVYQQWLQTFGPDVPLPEDERNLPGYPKSVLYTVTGEEGPRYRYCSKERVWKPRSYFPMSNGRFLCTCSHCKGSDLRKAAKRRGEPLEDRNEDLSPRIQPNKNESAQHPRPIMPIVNTDQRKYTVANLPLMPKAKPYTAKPVPKYPMPAPAVATPALGPPEENISRRKELKEMHFEAERLQSRIIGHERMKKLHQGTLKKSTPLIKNTRSKKMAEAARLQDRISKSDDVINKASSELEDINLVIDLLDETDGDDIGYQNDNGDTFLPSIEEELNFVPSNIPKNVDNTSEAGVKFAGQTNDLLRFPPKPHGYPPLDDDGHVLSNNGPFEQDPKVASGLDAMVEKDFGDGTEDVDMNLALHTPATLSNFQTKSPQPQKEVNLNQFRALSVSKEVKDRHTGSHQAQSRQPSPRQRFQFNARTSSTSTSRGLDPHRSYQAPGHNSSYLQSQKATNAAAQHSSLTVHTRDSNPDHFKNPNPTAGFQFGQSTLGDSGSYGAKIKEDVGKSQTVASQQTRDIAQQPQKQRVQQLQPNATTKFSQEVPKARGFPYQIDQQVKLDEESQEAQDKLAQEQLPRPTRATQQPEQACDQLARHAKNFSEQQASEKRTQQNKKTRKASMAHDQVAQEQPAQEQPAHPTQLIQLAKQAFGRLAQDQLTSRQRAELARDAYDQIAHEKRTRQNELTPKANLAHDQLDQDQMDQDELYQDQLSDDQLAQKAEAARDVYDERAYEIRDQRDLLVEHAHRAHKQLSQLSQQTQLARQDQEKFRAQKAEYQTGRQRQTLDSLPNLYSLPIRESTEPAQLIQHLKRRAEEPLDPTSQSQPEHSTRRSKRARHKAETEAEMREREYRHAKRIQQREEMLDREQIEKATKLSLEKSRRSQKG